jgi:plasmid stabilization system protein ParE
MAEILDYIEARSPQGAETVRRRLQAVIGLLADHPDAGRVTNKGNLRRVVASPYPYVIFYRSDATGTSFTAFATLPVVRSKSFGPVRFVDTRYVII